MLGVTFGELWHAVRMLGLFCLLLAAAIKAGGGDVVVDPVTLEVGSSDWAHYVKEHFSKLNV